MIAIVDYGVANLGSMCNMLRRLGAEPECVATPETLLRADKLILPGIGAFDQGIEALAERSLIIPLRRRVLEEKIPILGVCLGVQLLGESSQEGKRPGLCLIDAKSERLGGDNRTIRVPHIGWSHIRPLRTNRLLDGLDASSRFYFVHSYHVVCSDAGDVLATVEYGTEFTAMVHKDNIYGAQFHPEKSHRFGMRLLQNFLEL